MDGSNELRKLYLRYGCCMAYIAIERNGDAGIGSAFHVGDGIFVTARHVLEDSQIIEIKVTDEELFYRSDLYPRNENGSYTITPDSPKICSDISGHITIDSGPYFHPDPEVDIAAFRASGIAPGAHYVPLGGHLDDWVGKGDFEMTRAVVLGYPPIPFTREPILVAARAEVNAVVDLPGRHSMHFILSAMPRGGFSGGVVISEYGFTLGTVTQSLLAGNYPVELGFFTSTAIEGIYECLARNGVLPECQKKGWDGLWNPDSGRG
jgi:hypothetical protein